MATTSSIEAEMFATAIEIECTSERQEYLHEVCKDDPRLYERLNKLLKHASDTVCFLDSPPHVTGFSIENEGAYESVGDVIGPYKLLQKIGEGGMGTVFMADQKEPVQRRVAIKVVKPGMDSAQVLSRFETERQSLVLMDHPNIARALDVGTTERGRPYFVMELVKGIPISRYCDERRLDTSKRLELFIPVCCAIQHAHLKGIIHRDLKPSNILVAEYDNQSVPKVIDFGVAKAVNQQLTQRTMFTQLGQVVGTVEYMSPEQSKLNQWDVDTRSDIYSLGVLLYELLAGSTPIECSRLKEVDWDELTRMIREEEPPIPSVRISKSETIANIAACRQTEPGRLSRVLRGELDWIVMKALDKDRSRRYQTANEFALDIQRYLNNEAVLACPPSTLYQLSKFARRHRFPLISGVLVVCSLMLGLVGTLWQARQAQRATILAEHERDVANEERNRAQQAERQASQSAEQARRESEISQAIGKFVNQDLLAFADPDLEPDRTIQLRTLLDRASTTVSELQSAPLVEAAMRTTLATAYLNLGEYRESNAHAVRALELKRNSLGESSTESLEALLLIAELQLKRNLFREASKTFQQAIDLCNSKVGERNVLTLRGLRGLGISWFQLGRLDIARDHLSTLLETQTEVLGAKHRETFETRRELAELLQAKGRYRDALAEFYSMLPEMIESLGKAHPLTLKTQAGLASVLLTLGKFDESRLIREAILESQSKVLGAEHPDTLLSASALSNVSLKKGWFKEAELQQRKLISIAESRLGEQHLVTIHLSTVLAEILSELGNLVESKHVYEKSQKAIAELLDHNNPLSLRLKYRHAGLAAFSGQYDEALSRYQEVLDAQRLALGPYHIDTLNSVAAIAEIQMNQRKYDESQSIVSELICSAEQSLGSVHPVALKAKGRLLTLMSLRGEKENALVPYRELLESCDREHGKKTPISLELAVSFAEAQGRLGFAKDSIVVYEEILKDSDELFGPEHPTTLRIQDSLATALRLTGQLADARKVNEEVLAIRKRTLGDEHPLTLRSMNNLGTCWVDAGNPKEGAKMFRLAFDASKANFGSSFSATLEYGQNLASTLGLLREGSESLNLFEEILSVERKTLGENHPSVLFTQMGMAGAYSHLERFVEAERLYASVLDSQRQILGESHPTTLQCLEKLLITVGRQNRFQEAIELGRDYLAIAKDKYPGSPTTHRVMHCIIEYYIVQGRTLEAKPFFEQSQDWLDRYKLSPDWMINDLPYFAFSFVQSAEPRAAETVLQQHAENCSARYGTDHAATMQAEIELAKFLQLHDKASQAAELLMDVKKKLDKVAGTSAKDDTRLTLAIAMLTGNSEDLNTAAENAASQGNWLKALTLYSRCASIETDRVNEGTETCNEFIKKATESLKQTYRKGLITKPRELALLKYSSGFELCRRHRAFSELIEKIDRKLDANLLTQLAWSHAMAGNHVLAKKKIDELLKLDTEPEQEMDHHYNSGCVFSRCYESVLRGDSEKHDSNASSLADEYLKLTIKEVEKCWNSGYFDRPGARAHLKQDGDFDPVRNTIEFQKLMIEIAE